MKRRLILIGVLLVALAVPLHGQTFAAQIQQFWNQLRTGAIAFSTGRVQTSGYLNFGATVGTSGYGIRDNAGAMQFKDSGGAWADFGSGGGLPAGSTNAIQYNAGSSMFGGVALNATATPMYLQQISSGVAAFAQIATSDLSGTVANTQGGTGQNSAAWSALVKVTAGVWASYTGTSCTNQAVTALSALGAATCTTLTSAYVNNTIALTGTDIDTSNQVTATHLAAALPVAQGGTALASGTSGGVLAYTASGTLASSGALAATALVIGGGAGVVPLTDANWTIEQTSHVLTTTTQPRATVKNSAAQSINTGTETPLTFDTNTDAVPATIHSTSSNTSRFVAPVGGWYCLAYTVGFATSASVQYAYVRKGGTTQVGSLTQVLGNVTSVVMLAQTVCMTLSAAEYVEVIANQTSGMALNTAAGAYLPSVNFWKQF